MNRASPIISVVLPTFNRRAALTETLRCLERQSFPMNDVEVIIVDDGSSDRTKELLQEETKSSPLRMKWWTKKHEGPGAARNYGVERAEGSVIAFIEDDVTPEPDWLRNAATYFDDPSVAGVEGTTVVQSSTTSLRVHDPEGFLSFIPCNFFIRKEAFLDVHGYDPEYFDTLTNLYFREDIDFGFRLMTRGFRILKASNVIVVHSKQFQSVKDAFRHARRYYFDPLLYKKHPAEYRGHVEVKAFGPLRIHRPFHYLSSAYVMAFLMFLLSLIYGGGGLSVSLLILLITIFSAIQYRYWRSGFPAGRRLLSVTSFLILPFYYYYWLIRGCRKFGSWGLLR